MADKKSDAPAGRDLPSRFISGNETSFQGALTNAQDLGCFTALRCRAAAPKCSRASVPLTGLPTHPYDFRGKARDLLTRAFPATMMRTVARPRMSPSMKFGVDLLA